MPMNWAWRCVSWPGMPADGTPWAGRAARPCGPIAVPGRGSRRWCSACCPRGASERLITRSGGGRRIFQVVVQGVDVLGAEKARLLFQAQHVEHVVIAGIGVVPL